MAIKHNKTGLVAETYLTYEELSGRRSSPEEFKEELCRFPSELLLRLCSAVSLLVFGWSARFDKRRHDQLAEKLCPLALPHLKARPLGVLFHRQMLLLVAKEALRQGPRTPAPLTAWPDLTRLFTMANDQLDQADKPAAVQAGNLAQLVRRYLPVSEFQLHQPAIRLSRPYVMLSKLAELTPEGATRFNIPQMFEEASGLSPDVYFPLVMGCMAKYLPLSAEDLFKSPQAFALRLDWFSRTRLDKAKLERFLADVSADYDEFQELLRRFDRGLSDFTIFRERPIVRLGGEYYPVDLAFLAAKSESAFFWRSHDSLPSSERGAFHAFWGELFERYMHRLLKQSADGSLNRYYASPRYAVGNEQVCDGILLCKDSTAVFFEFKGSMFRADAKWGSNSAVLERELQAKLVEGKDGEPKGVKQLANAISNVFRDWRAVAGVNLARVDKVYPVLVTYDEIGDAWFLGSYLNEWFRRAVNGKNISATVTPLFCMSADCLEGLAGVLNSVPLSSILEARYKQDKSLKLPFWLPNNAALKGVKWAAPATLAEASEELGREAERLFPNSLPPYQA
ncbi:MAG: hypothetical protein M1336_02195 [Deltaproteobacteria bacterium]|nr:hypothetical protein [Deltaproteobacteria bacterium]